MAIVQTLTKSAFIDAFKQSSRKDQFSYEALEAIFDYLEEYSEETGENVEFDIVGICCDYFEGTGEDICRDYGIDTDGIDDDEIIEAAREYLEDEGVLVGETPSGFVYRAH